MQLENDQNYLAWMTDLNAAYVNASSLNWGNYKQYVFLSNNGKVLNKIITDIIEQALIPISFRVPCFYSFQAIKAQRSTNCTTQQSKTSLVKNL